MRRLIYSIFFIFFLSPSNNIYAACSGSDCCTVTSGVVTWPDNSSCALEPDAYSISMYNMYLCTSAPSAPTTSSATGYTAAGCVLVLDASAGSSISITPGGNAQAFSGANFIRPPNNTYTHGVMLIDNVFYITLDRQFDTSITGGSSGTGAYCATIAGSADETTGGSMVCSASDNLTAGAWGAVLTSFNGLSSFLTSVSASNLNGTGASISGHLVNSSEQIAASRATVDKLVGIQTFAAPVVIEKTFRGLDVAFGINQGTTCWDDSGGEGNTIECGSGPFQAIITPLNYE